MNVNTFLDQFVESIESIESNIMNEYNTSKRFIGYNSVYNLKIYACLTKYIPVLQMIDVNNKIVYKSPISDPLSYYTINLSDAKTLFRPIIEGNIKNLEFMTWTVL